MTLPVALARQFRDDDDPRPLEARQRPRAVGGEVADVNRGDAGPRHDGGDDLFPVDRIRKTDDARFSHVRVPDQHRFDFGRRHVGAGADDHVAEPAEDPDVSVVVELDQVPGAVPAVVGQRRRRHRGIVPIAQEQRRPADPGLTGVRDS